MAIVDKINALTGTVNGNGSIEDALAMLLEKGIGGGSSIMPTLTVVVTPDSQNQNSVVFETTCDMTMDEMFEKYKEGLLHTVRVNIDMTSMLEGATVECYTSRIDAAETAIEGGGSIMFGCRLVFDIEDNMNPMLPTYIHGMWVHELGQEMWVAGN